MAGTVAAALYRFWILQRANSGEKVLGKYFESKIMDNGTVVKGFPNRDYDVST